MIKGKENNMGMVKDMGVINQKKGKIKRENIQGTTQNTKMIKRKKKLYKHVALTHDYK
jgi:hypothetical protein